MSVSGDACNRGNTFNGERSSTKTFNKQTNHHSQSSWSMGWTEPEKATPSTSANRFANGSNQNCGNVMTDVPTSRVLAPPGGKSNWSIGGGPTGPAPAQSARAPAPFATDAPASTGHGVGISGSANAFANGANQNSGNFLTDVPSSRVLAPPGGKSNWSIGGGPTGPAPARSARGGQTSLSGPIASSSTGISGSANRFANGANQNCGNVMTDVPSSRVLAPPGGKSNWSIGGWSEPAPAESVRVTRAPPAPGAAKAYSPPKLAETTNMALAPAARTKGNNVGISGSANAFANGANQNCGNFLTDKPSSRVLAPPGGRSSITFG